jgi:hypothetical protein
LEKHATEEGGVTPSVYSRKDTVCIMFFLPLLWMLFSLCFTQELQAAVPFLSHRSMQEHLLGVG